MMASIAEINRMNQRQFVGFLGAVFENSPWIAAAAWKTGPFGSAAELHGAMMNVVLESKSDVRLELLRAHPDLGTRLAVAELSALEQRGAGLSELTEAEYTIFLTGNQRYVQKFGFPYILAVRGKSKADILADMEARMTNSAAEEMERALLEVGRITSFRVYDLITAIEERS